MTGVPINLCFWIATCFGREEQRNFDVLYALILRIMSQKFGADSFDLGLIKRRVDPNLDYSFCNRSMFVRGLCQSCIQARCPKWYRITKVAALQS